MVMENEIKYSFKLGAAVVEHGRADEVVGILGGSGVNFCTVFIGRGTADSEIMELLGLGDSSKDIVFFIAETEQIPSVLAKIHDGYRGSGVVFTVRLKSIGGRRVIDVLRGGNNG